MADDIELPEGLNPAQFVKDYLLKNPEYFRTHSDVFCRLVPPRQNREGTRSIIECQNEVLRAHGDAIVDGYGVELGGKQSVASDLSLYTAADIMEMGVTRHKLSE